MPETFCVRRARARRLQGRELIACRSEDVSLDGVAAVSRKLCI